MSEVETWSTRDAARYLDISTTALLRKVELLGAFRRGRGYRWPMDRVKAYGRAVAGKDLSDPTRGQELR